MSPWIVFKGGIDQDHTAKKFSLIFNLHCPLPEVNVQADSASIVEKIDPKKSQIHSAGSTRVKFLCVNGLQAFTTQR